MQTDYQIEDIISQSYDFVMYLAHDREKRQIALIRLRYPEGILTKLTDKVFANAFTQLQLLNHPSLRTVLDGGLDPVDRHPWIAVLWEEGLTLVDRIKISDLTQPELIRLQTNGQALIDSLGPVAGAVSFSPHSLVISESEAGLVDTFSIDYYSWFSSFARGVHPASEFDVSERFNTFLTYLNRRSELSSTPLLTARPQENSVPQAAPFTPTKTSAFPLKTILVLTTLLIAIGCGLWIVTKNKKAPEPAPVVTKKTPPPTPIQSAPVRPKSVKNSPRPARPRLDVGFLRLDSVNTDSLENHVGSWVRISGKISAHESSQLLIFDKSTLRASLPADSGNTAENSVDKAVTIKGFLKSATLLEVQDVDDIDIAYLPKDFYTTKDEDQLRGMAGESVTIEAEILSYQPSNSGKTLYLLFKKDKPEFSIGIQKSKAEESLSETYLKSLVGKTLRVEGRLKIESRGNRLSVVVAQKSQVEVIE